MIHDLLSNPQIHDQIQKILLEMATLAGSIAIILISQAAKAIKESHLGIVQKMVAEKVVKYAEQTMQNPGPDKLAYVVATLKAKFPQLDEQELTQLAEAAVHSMNTTSKGDLPQ